MSCHLNITADDPAAARLGLGAAALRYVALGFAVLPLEPAGKRPHKILGEHGGVHHASADPAFVEWAWSASPAANIGVACGSRSGLLVVDLDVKNGYAGPEIFRGWMAQRGLMIPPGPWQSTPHDGEHRWLRLAPGYRVPGRQAILPGADVKGDGGYVVAAPSMLGVTIGDRPGDHGPDAPVPVPYEWHGCPCSLPGVPEWMWGWLESVPETAETGEYGGGGGPVGMDEPLAGGQRNIQLHRRACILYLRNGTDPAGEAAVRQRVEHILSVSDTGGFPAHEVATILASARKWAAAQIEAQRFDALARSPFGRALGVTG